MTEQSSRDSAFRALAGAGAHVRTYHNSNSVLYSHAKAVAADAGRAIPLVTYAGLRPTVFA